MRKPKFNPDKYVMCSLTEHKVICRTKRDRVSIEQYCRVCGVRVRITLRPGKDSVYSQLITQFYDRQGQILNSYQE